MLGAVRGDPDSGGQRDLLQGRVGQELCCHSRQAVRQDGAVHGGRDQVQIAAPQHAAGESAGREWKYCMERSALNGIMYVQIL